MDVVSVASVLLSTSGCTWPDFPMAAVFALELARPLNSVLRNRLYMEFSLQEEVTLWDGSYSHGLFLDSDVSVVSVALS